MSLLYHIFMNFSTDLPFSLLSATQILSADRLISATPLSISSSRQIGICQAIEEPVGITIC